MSVLKNLFKQTVIYGLATVFPRVLSFILLPLYTHVLPTKAEYGKVSIIFAWIVVFNVILAYGMETAFFRFYHDDKTKNSVKGTSAISIAVSSLIFLGLALYLKSYLAALMNIDVKYITFVIWILVLDALVIIPFSILRAKGKSMTYSVLKIVNVAVNLGLNVFFLVLLKDLVNPSKEVFWNSIWFSGAEISYIFISNLIASLLTLLMLLPVYFKIKFRVNFSLLKKMLRFGFPVMVAGLAYAVNETFDRILLDYLLPPETAESQIGEYSACYKLALFITLFATAFRLGIEPFFFSHSKEKNSKETYAVITKYFVLIGLGILLSVIVFVDVLKELFISDESYWEAMTVVPYILLANLCLGIYFNLSVWYKITDRTKFGAYFSVVGALVTLALNFWLIPIIGYKGSAIATLSAYGTMMILSWYFGKKHYPIPYNLKKLGIFTVLALGFSALSFLLFRGNLVIGVLLIAVFFGALYVSEHKELKQFLK